VKEMSFNCRFCFSSRRWPVAYATKSFHLYSNTMAQRSHRFTGIGRLV